MLVAVNTASEVRADVLIGVAFEGVPASWLAAYGMEDALALGEHLGGADALTVLAVPAGSRIPLLCVAGVGKSLPNGSCVEEQACFLERLRSAIASAMSKARSLKAEHVALDMAGLENAGLEDELAAHEAVYAARLGLYRYQQLKHDDDLVADPQQLTLVFSGKDPGALEKTAAQAVAEAEAVCLARDLVNTPANLLPPLALAGKARELAADLPLSCTVLEQGALREEGLNTLLAVAQGSANPPALICLEYVPAGQESADPLVLVGKGLVFDSGGISLKPSLGMHEMKGDMAGAAAVLAAMALIARLGGKQRVVALLPCAENMPDGLAMRPGDVIRTMKGTTVEVLNTDAEGRLVLCDALTYAQKHWRPKAIVDIATLTGACVVALGADVAGLFATDDALAESLASAGLARGERFWRMPLWDLYAEGIKSMTADLANVGPREGGAVSAAMFLKHFVDGPWAHLDIAGPSYNGKKKGASGGATGFGVRTLAALGF